MEGSLVGLQPKSCLRVAMTGDKCTRAGFCGQRKPLQNIRSGEQTKEQTGEQDAPRRRAPGSRRVQRRRSAQRRVQQRQIERTPVLLEPVAAALEVTSDATNAGTTEAAEAVRWQAADQLEIDAILQLGTWESGGCVLSAGKQALPTHFVRNLKRDSRYTSHLVAKGHKQRPGVDFKETFAPVCSYRTLHMMLAVAAHAGLVLRQFDIKRAFLHGYLKDEVYVQPQRGWEHLAGGSGGVLRLCRALYGLRQAPWAWNERLEAELIMTARGFVQSNAGPCLWIICSKDGAVLTMFYVDDGMVAARNGVEADALVDVIASIFEIRRVREPQDMLGIEISRDLAAGTITIRQCAKAKALAAMFGVEGERHATPMTPAAQASLRAACEGHTMADIVRYQSGVSSLLHPAQCVRPDIAAPVGALAAYNSMPTDSHFAAMLDVIRYVGSTAERGITYGQSSVPVAIWYDANFVGCPDTWRSVSGCVVVCFGGAVSWESCKQTTTAVSTIDAEYQACGSVAREALSLRKLLREFLVLCREIWPGEASVVLCDN
jgi:hypothetical protein